MAKKKVKTPWRQGFRASKRPTTHKKRWKSTYRPDKAGIT